MPRAIIVVFLLLVVSSSATAQSDPQRLFWSDWKDIGSALAPDAQPEKRAWALGYVAGILDELGCRTDRSVDPAVELKKSQAEIEKVANMTYQIYLEQQGQKALSEMSSGFIGATAFVRAATVRLWKCELKRKP